MFIKPVAVRGAQEAISQWEKMEDQDKSPE